MRGISTLAIAVLVVLASVGAVAAPMGETITNVQETPTEPPPDPDGDVTGWENGVWHNESIDVDQRDGLSDQELRVYVARSMARVEYIRGQEFKRSVPVEAVSRSDFRGVVQTLSGTTPTQRATENQLWEALFMVDEPTDAVEQSRQGTAKGVAGLYMPFFGQIYVISDAGGRLVVDNATLIHELTHGLQDQYHDLDSPTFQATTLDGRLGQLGLTEGAANYVMTRYTQRCESGEWECVSTPRNERSNRSSLVEGPLPETNLGMQIVSFQPYSDGPAYVNNHIERGGWEAVEDAFRDPPASSEQIIHPERRDDSLTPMNFTSTARDGWKILAPRGSSGYQTVGEAGIYAMFWYQGRAYDNSIIDWREFAGPDRGPYDRYNYTSRPSEGWANDRLYVYFSGDERGYVWKTTWDSERDAREFERAYRAVLDGHGAVEVDERTWVIREGGFADAFRVSREGRTVTIVNGPNATSVSNIRPTDN